MASGTEGNLAWLRDKLKNHYDLKSDLLGERHNKVGCFLKRSIQWTSTGIVWSSDAKHAAEIRQQWSSSTPRRNILPVESAANHPSEGDELATVEVTSFRSAAARVQ